MGRSRFARAVAAFAVLSVVLVACSSDEGGGDGGGAAEGGGEESNVIRFTFAPDPAWDWIFTPVTRLVGWIADRVDTLQFLTIRSYLSLMFFALIVLLVMVAVPQ